jgi:hypothetical protein
MPSRITAIAAIIALIALMPLFCCTTMFAMPASGCCKGHCMSGSASPPLLAVTHAKVRLPALAVAAILDRHTTAGASSTDALPHEAALATLFLPIAKIQLRI